jgi:hypothetical protein
VKEGKRGEKEREKERRKEKGEKEDGVTGRRKEDK